MDNDTMFIQNDLTVRNSALSRTSTNTSIIMFFSPVLHKGQGFPRLQDAIMQNK